MKNPFTAEARARAGLRLQQERQKQNSRSFSDGESFDPSQPRAPKGDPHGGRWIKGNGGADGYDSYEPPVSQFSELSSLLDGEAPDDDSESQPTQASVVAPLVQGAARAAATVRIAPHAQKAVQSALAAYAGYLALPDPNSVPVFAFSAKQFPGKAAATIEFAQARTLTRDEAKSLCGRLDDVQRLTDAAVSNNLKDPRPWRPVDFGTAVHSDVAHGIDAIGDENFKKEVSILKGLQETAEKRLYGNPVQSASTRCNLSMEAKWSACTTSNWKEPSDPRTDR